MRVLVLICIILSSSSAVAQFAPQAGVQGSTAISSTDSRFIGWAKNCIIQRGWQDIADKTKGLAGVGSGPDAVGTQTGSIVSLGDSGVATLTFSAAIYNGQGADFAVFENGFANPADPEEAYLELAFVEVSSDGVNFVRFPATCNIDTPQIPGVGVYSNARKINNLAGKYTTGYGTPFDLEELKGNPELDIDNITHVRIVDAIGSLGAHGTLDKNNNKVNDPYPTPFNSSGFDLDAVGVIHLKGGPQSVREKVSNTAVRIYPNPATNLLVVQASNSIEGAVVYITDATGRVILKNDLKQAKQLLDISNFQSGIYLIYLKSNNQTIWTDRFTKY